MTGDDWLVGGARRDAAAERIYAAATDLIVHGGLNALDIDKLAARVHCSRATIYRCVGGKAQIRDVVLNRAAARIADGVRSDVETLRGRERVVAAILLSLHRIRSDPLGKLMIGSVRGGAGELAWLTESPLLADFATDLTGATGGDPHGAKWVVRVVLSLMYWPAENDEAERRLVEKYVAPAFAEQG
ncbi:putative transcriptional regulatory protein [Mycobacterium canetti]|uniref:TetR/AcrR family transcriptional regulator n=1 Tax=Mycobacterium canetti TaxID=78331 RepID=UPI002D7A0F93|nr:TetR/AcrR family transcriptional regulator [Mycobacterium canetti]WRO41824.1 putative transcriptional regulatory protein [Mycobacterium canetti]